MNLFDFSLKLNGFPIEKAKAHLATIQEQNSDDFSRYLEERKNAILNYHLKNNTFYQEFTKGVKTCNWNNLPIMTKRDLQQPLEKRLSHNFKPTNVYVNKTSGSSGDPFIFAKDKFCHALTWANFIDNYSQFNLDPNTSKQARFYGIPLDKKGYYKERLKDSLSNRFRFSVFDLSEKQLEKNVKKFESSAFDYINGYTSSIVQFAKFLRSNNIVLKTICPSLKACIVTSEMLFASDKELLSSQLGVPIINEYGAAELGLLAFANTRNEWVVNNTDLYIEILDENNNVLPFGEEGRVIVTSLFNKAHPFIRYDLGDIGALSTVSTQQKPILKELYGRTNDIVKLPSGKKAAGLTFYYVTKTVIEKDGNVKEFIIEQLGLDTFKISYVSDTELTSEKIEDIKSAISKYLEPNLTIEIKRKQQLNRSNRGKLKQFKSYL